MSLSAAVLFVALLVTPVGERAAAQSMKPISSRDTPAHRAALRFMRGINLSNDLEYAPNDPARTQSYSINDFVLIRAEGFDHVRLPVAWHLYAGPGPDFVLSNSIFAKADLIVNGVLSQGLSVLLELHNFDAFMTDPAGNRQKFYAIWRQVGAHYSNAPPTVAFELLNEPNGNATTSVMNQIYPEAIRQLRLSNPDRTLFLGPGQWNGLGELKITSSPSLLFPDADTNLIATVHCYDPFYFTHQGAEWALPDTATTGVVFPGPPSVPLRPHSSITHSWVLDWFRLYNNRPTSLNPSSQFAFQGELQAARAWSEHYGRPVYVGEFGCYEKSDADSRVNFCREIRAVMDQQGLGWAMWDWKAGFHYFKAGRPEPPGMRHALFPPLSLRIQLNGVVEWDGAVGKSYQVDQTASLAPPIFWQVISTQTLVLPQTPFYVPDPNPTASQFYRVRWVK
ncbi:MAG: glycoside hydrolase family 5 protein [Verrucomicrobiota bacterium]